MQKRWVRRRCNAIRARVQEQGKLEDRSQENKEQHRNKNMERTEATKGKLCRTMQNDSDKGSQPAENTPVSTSRATCSKSGLGKPTEYSSVRPHKRTICQNSMTTMLTLLSASGGRRRVPVSEQLGESACPFCDAGSSQLLDSGGGRRSPPPHLRFDSKLPGMFGDQIPGAKGQWLPISRIVML